MKSRHVLTLTSVQFELISLHLVLVHFAASSSLIIQSKIVARETETPIQQEFIVLNLDLVCSEAH